LNKFVYRIKKVRKF